MRLRAANFPPPKFLQVCAADSGTSAMPEHDAPYVAYGAVARGELDDVGKG